MATNNYGSFTTHVPVFYGKIYDQWIVKMKVIFRYQDVLDAAKDGLPMRARNTTKVQQIGHKDAKKKDGKSMFLIHQGVNDEILEKIMHRENAKET